MRTDIAGILCDLDGTLVNTENVHLRAWRDIVAQYGHTLPEGWERLYIGNPDPDWAARCAGMFPSLPDPETLLAERHALYRSLLRRHGGETAFPGVRTELESLAGMGFKMAVGTNSPLENTTVALEYAGLLDLFPDVVAFGMTPRGKPAPDIFLAAAARLGLEPGRCVVLEDSGPGVRAGKDAGALVLGLTTTSPPEALAGADRIFAATLEALRWIRENFRPA